MNIKVAVLTIVLALTVSPVFAKEKLTIDCTAANPQCPQLTVSGDSPDESNFRGFADPSIRLDPDTGTLWLTYS